MTTTRLILMLCLTISASLSFADETFVVIHRVSGQSITVSKSAEGGSRRGGMSGRRGGRAANNAQQTAVVRVPSDAKITSAMRERRTFEFRVGAELAGGLRHKVFRGMSEPLQARVVTRGDRILEINVIVPEIDINQTGTNGDGQTVIAVRPKRPPMKRP